MRVSSGVRGAINEAGKWLAVSSVAIATIVWFDELKAGLSQGLELYLSDRVAAPKPSAQRDDAGPPGTVELRADRSGHFLAKASVNGRPIEMLVDTGASLVALSFEDAERVGVYVRPGDFTSRVQTANGIAWVAPVTLDSLSIGDITLYDVKAVVSEPGRLGTSLLGMTFIGRLGRAEMRDGVLVLQE
jgi:aspartyl protease family protein